MTAGTPTRRGRGLRGLSAYGALAALIVGLTAGTLSPAWPQDLRDALLEVAGFVGTVWLNALKMTVIPLVVALLVVGIAKSSEAARAGRVAARTVMWAVGICTASAVFGALMLMLITSVFPLPRDTAGALQLALAGIDPSDSDKLAGVADFFRNIVPDNVVAAASNGDALPLVIFTVLFALALSRIAPDKSARVVGLFDAIADALLIIVGWVLRLAPLGVFALAFTVGNAAGGAAFAGLGHYVVVISAIGILVTLAAYPLATIAGRLSPGNFAAGIVGSQAVAISTRSSLASLPAMLAAARAMGVRETVADIALPICVALFRATGPAMNTAVAFYVAHWLGLEPSLPQVVAAIAVGAVMSYGAVSLPGEISFISSIAPIAMALGVPVAPLALLVAVEMVPDIFRTVGNVTMDVAVTAAVDRGSPEGPAS